MEKMRANLLRAISTICARRSPASSATAPVSGKSERSKLHRTAYDHDQYLRGFQLAVEYGGKSAVRHPYPGRQLKHQYHRGAGWSGGRSFGEAEKRYPDAAIRVRIPEEFLMIPMDAVLIEQVTINLLENAIVHSGSILPIDFIVEDHPEHVSFIVRDYGKGLSEEKLQNLFETGTYNNSRSSDSRKGMGIGLSICKTIITPPITER